MGLGKAVEEPLTYPVDLQVVQAWQVSSSSHRYIPQYQHLVQQGREVYRVCRSPITRLHMPTVKQNRDRLVVYQRLFIISFSPQE